MIFRCPASGNGFPLPSTSKKSTIEGGHVVHAGQLLSFGNIANSFELVARFELVLSSL